MGKWAKVIELSHLTHQKPLLFTFHLMQKLRKNNMRQWQEFTFSNNNLSTPFILQNLLDFNTNGKKSTFLFRKRVRNVLLCATSHLISVDISWLTPNKYIFRFETVIPKLVAVVCTPVANIQWDEYGCWTYWWHIDLQWQTDLWHQWWFCPRFSLHLFHTTNTLRHYKTFPNVLGFHHTEVYWWRPYWFFNFEALREHNTVCFNVRYYTSIPIWRSIKVN